MNSSARESNQTLESTRGVTETRIFKPKYKSMQFFYVYSEKVFAFYYFNIEVLKI